MSWLRTATAEPASFEDVLALRPELLAEYTAFYSQLWRDPSLPAGLLELARLRIAQLHDCEVQAAMRRPASGVSDEQLADLASWQRSERFSDLERAALAIAEKMPWQHHEITDAEAAALRDRIGEPAFVTFMTACALFDANCRLRIVFDVEPRPSSDASAPAEGRLS